MSFREFTDDAPHIRETIEPRRRKLPCEAERLEQLRLDDRDIIRRLAIVQLAKQGREPLHERRVRRHAKFAAPIFHAARQPHLRHATLHAMRVHLLRIRHRRPLPPARHDHREPFLRILDDRESGDERGLFPHLDVGLARGTAPLLQREFLSRSDGTNERVALKCPPSDPFLT